jgi:hypothetical protein
VSKLLLVINEDPVERTIPADIPPLRRTIAGLTDRS